MPAAKKTAESSTKKKGRDPLPYMSNLNSATEAFEALSISKEQQKKRVEKAQKDAAKGKVAKPKKWDAGTLLGGSQGKKQKTKKGGGKKKVLGSMQDPEFKLQSAAVAYLKGKYPRVMFNGSLAGIGIAACTQRARLQGYRVGWPDLEIMMPKGKYAGLFFEFKIHPNVASDAQLVTHEQLRLAGYYVVVCYSIDDFMRILNWYMALPESVLITERYAPARASSAESIQQRQPAPVFNIATAPAIMDKPVVARSSKQHKKSKAAIVQFEEEEDETEEKAAFVNVSARHQKPSSSSRVIDLDSYADYFELD